ncbi:MAG: prealbumin-like fold domain-containing protein, partial [Oscillospiraceae bacterium]|nr:prealbumin-like fold domain-containing protein [Oscillospiraceae bacterium]
TKPTATTTTTKPTTTTTTITTTTEATTTTEEITTEETIITEETTTTTTIPERKITIHKIAPTASSATLSEDGVIYNIEYALHDMAGVTFGIYDAEGNLVETVITDENGYAESSILYGDIYTVQEIQTISGYVIHTEPYTIDFTTTEGDTANVEITNDIIRCQIHLSKQLEGDAGDITMVQFGLYTAQEIPLLDGTVIPSDSCIGIANAQEDGTIIFENALPAGNYYVKELATADGYVLSDTIYPVEVIYPEDQTIADITFEVNNGDPIINYQTTTEMTTTTEENTTEVTETTEEIETIPEETETTTNTTNTSSTTNNVTTTTTTTTTTTAKTPSSPSTPYSPSSPSSPSTPNTSSSPKTGECAKPIPLVVAIFCLTAMIGITYRTNSKPKK